MTQPVEITKVNGKFVTLGKDELATEEPLEIRVGARSLSVTMRTPGHDFDLALGFLFTEGIIRSKEEVASTKYCVGATAAEANVLQLELKPEVTLDWDKLQRNFYTTSSCGVCGKSSIDSIQAVCQPIVSVLQVSTDVIGTLPQTLREAQRLFDRTGGLHAAAAFDADGRLIVVREDVGRHNALDKVIGSLLTNRTPGADRILLVSGRASFELVQKVAVAGFPILAAVGAPSSLAVSLAKETGMTLIGFLRGNSFNIYCHESRVALLLDPVSGSHP